MDRDKKILISLFKNKILRLDQIQNHFFKNKSQSVVSRRMGKLFDIGLIKKRLYYDLNKIKMAYEITEEGLACIKDEIPHEINFRYYVSDSHIHDMNLFDICNGFKQFEAVSEVITESELQSVSDFLSRPRYSSFVSLRSDRLLIIRVDNCTSYVALEYERTLKSSQRIEKKFSDYYRESSVEAVLYVCENQSILKSMMKVDQSLRQYTKSKIYFCTLSDVQKETDELVLRKHDGGKLHFRKNQP